MAPGIASDPFCGALWLWLPPNTAWNDIPLRSLERFSLLCMWNLVVNIKEYFQRGERERCGIGGTYKVRSLGMWLKLETGMLLMLLLFSVLRKRKRANKVTSSA